VFAGGWTLEAAEAVTVSVDLPAEDVLHRLSVLVDNSLIRRVDQVAGEPRFGMLETIREYALERLSVDGEEAEVRNRHLAFCLALAETAEPHLAGAEQAPWADRLERELDNVRAALAWAADSAQPLLGLRLASALRYFWFMRGHHREGSERIRAALTAGEGTADPALRARALAALGFVLVIHGQYAEAHPPLEAALAVGRALGDDPGTAFALRYLGFAASALADHAAAGRFLDESLALYRRLGLPDDVARALMYRGDVALRLDDAEHARQFFEESSTLLERLHNKTVLPYPLRRLGHLARLRGDLQLAVRLCIDSLNHNREVGELQGQAASLVGLALIAEQQGEPGLAIQLLAKADALLAPIGSQLLPFDAEQLEQATTRLRAQVEPTAWDEAWATGQRLSLDEAVRIARELPSSAPPGPTAEITSRQRDILRLLAAGHTNREIADALKLSVATVERHLANTYARIGARGRADATRYAVRVGLVSPESPER
jgi:DNA-binding CsgD family transcriptional regulator